MKNFVKAALIRAARTMAECALAYIGSAALVSQVDWLGVLSSAAMGGIISILLAVATGLPEAPREGDK
jgi:hypothetical protein